MRVLMLTNVTAPDKLGGLERYVRELAARLVSSGVEVTVAAKRIHDSPQVEVGEDGVNILRYNPPAKSDKLFALKYPLAINRGVRTAVRDALAAPTDTPIIHGHFPVPMLPLIFGRRSYVYTMHAPVYKEIVSERQDSYALPGPTETLAVKGMKSVEAKVLRQTRTLITLSEFVANEARAIAPSVAVRSTQIPGGIDLQRFKPSPSPRPPREIPAGPVVFAARRMVLRTGIEELVRAFATVAAQHPSATLVLAGDGPRRAAVNSMIDTLGLAGRVLVLGRISDEELVEWYQCATVAVTPTQALEGFGLSTAEAMACGAMPLVTPIGANREVVQTLPSNEYVTDDESPQALARGILALLAPAKLSRDTRSQISTAAQRYGWENVVARHLEVYENYRKSKHDAERGK